MPGFNIGSTGAGEAQADGRVEVRRKYRWILDIPKIGGRAWAYVKSANRPKMTLGQIEQHHNQEKIWHEGKTAWNDLTCVFYDVENQPDVSKEIYDWLGATTYDIPGANAFHPRNYKNTLTLKTLQAGGEANETWRYYHAWPYDVDWGGLDYSAEELCEVTAIFKYDRAQKA